jgi:GTP pyrophosphokinase
MPKFNMYQSLHTTVIGPAGRPLEIQIRTEEMHRTAEYGIAAHWRYKEGGRADEAFDERLSWLRQMLEWQTELKDPREFMEALKIDLFEDEVFVFTPKGDVVSLRRGSTPIDFAYMIHTEVGHHCVGAKVNGSIVTLDYELQMGDRVDILTNKSSWPSRDWLNVVRTSSARSKIRSYFSKASREDDLVKGKDELGKVLRKQGMQASANSLGRALDKVAREMNLTEGEDLLAAIGSGKQSPKQVVTKLIKVLAKDDAVAVAPAPEGVIPVLQPSRAASRRRSATGVRVKGIDDVLVRLAHCCNPVPGDAIVGFVTRGRGVSVHRADCPNARELVSSSAERILDVEWDTETSSTYQVEILIEALDRTRLLQDISIALADAGVNVLSAAISTDRQGVAYLKFLFELGHMDQLQRVLSQVRAVDGVFDAQRTMPEGGKKRGGEA